MTPGRPLWRLVFDQVERTVGGPLEAIVRSEAFFDAVTISARTRRETAAQVERFSRRGLHLLNLPAGSDMRRLGEQVARLDRHVRELSKQLEES